MEKQDVDQNRIDWGSSTYHSGGVNRHSSEKQHLKCYKSGSEDQNLEFLYFYLSIIDI